MRGIVLGSGGEIWLSMRRLKSRAVRVSRAENSIFFVRFHAVAKSRIFNVRPLQNPSGPFGPILQSVDSNTLDRKKQVPQNTELYGSRGAGGDLWNAQTPKPAPLPLTHFFPCPEKYEVLKPPVECRRILSVVKTIAYRCLVQYWRRNLRIFSLRVCAVELEQVLGCILPALPISPTIELVIKDKG